MVQGAGSTAPQKIEVSHSVANPASPSPTWSIRNAAAPAPPASRRRTAPTWGGSKSRFPPRGCAVV